jgi:hypothetical protein
MNSMMLSKVTRKQDNEMQSRIFPNYNLQILQLRAASLENISQDLDNQDYVEGLIKSIAQNNVKHFMGPLPSTHLSLSLLINCVGMKKNFSN